MSETVQVLPFYLLLFIMCETQTAKFPFLSINIVLLFCRIGCTNTSAEKRLKDFFLIPSWAQFKPVLLSQFKGTSLLRFGKKASNVLVKQLLVDGVQNRHFIKSI